MTLLLLTQTLTANVYFARLFILVLRCLDIPMVGNASYEATSDYFELGTNITFTCREGYYLPDLNTTMMTTCQHVGGLETNYTEMPYDSCYGKLLLFKYFQISRKKNGLLDLQLNLYS